MELVKENNNTTSIIMMGRKVHIGLCQTGDDYSGIIKELLPHYKTITHNFATVEQLYRQNQRSYIDLIVLIMQKENDWVVKMIREMKKNSSLHFIPIMIHYPEASKDMVLRLLREGADDVSNAPWDDDLIAAKADMLISRSRRDLSINPSTRLPGASAIEYEVDLRLNSGRPFAVCYARRRDIFI